MSKIKVISLMRILFIAIGLLGCPSFGQAQSSICARALSGSKAVHFVEPSELNETLQLAMIDTLAHQPFLAHYSTRENMLSILEKHRILADDKNRVFLSPTAFSAAEAEQDLFIGDPNHRGRGEYVIILRPISGARLYPIPQKPFELLHNGSFRFRDEDVIYVGVNPFP